MKNFYILLSTSAAVMFAVLWKTEANRAERIRKSMIHKEFAHMDLRGDIIEAEKENNLEKVKEILNNALSDDVRRFFENKDGGDAWK